MIALTFGNILNYRMIKTKEENNRREFLKKCGLSTVPFLVPTVGLDAMTLSSGEIDRPDKTEAIVNFVYDGLNLSPRQYIDKLRDIDLANKLEPDFYGNGGSTKQLEDEFARLTGKEKAIYMPTGTMANQLAIKLLNGQNTKVVVPENSHVFRDEADAAQSVHGKRLVPVGYDKPYYELEDLESSINYLKQNEVFRSGLGTVVIENPIRRAKGTVVPIETIKEISAYCKKNGIKTHLDGARIHLAMAYTGISLMEYASYFDTVYISLYKYLNTAGGAILCGEAAIIDQLAHQIKILGGTVFQSWTNTSMALHFLDGIELRLKQMVNTASKLVTELNKIEGLKISALKNGTNIYDLSLTSHINSKELSTILYKEHDILIRSSDNAHVRFAVNESLLSRDFQKIVDAWRTAVKTIHK